MLEKIKDFFSLLKLQIKYLNLYKNYNRLQKDFNDLKEQIDSDFVEVII